MLFVFDKFIGGIGMSRPSFSAIDRAICTTDSDTNAKCCTIQFLNSSIMGIKYKFSSAAPFPLLYSALKLLVALSPSRELMLRHVRRKLSYRSRLHLVRELLILILRGLIRSHFVHTRSFSLLSGLLPS